MAMQTGVQQFEVFKMKDSKCKKLRILIIDNKPIVQLRSNKGQHLIEIDISSASKVFLPITSDFPFCFEVILRHPTIFPRLYCKDKQVFDLCVSSINAAITKYMQNRGTVESVLKKSKNRGTVESVLERSKMYESSEYITMISPNKDDVFIQDNVDKGSPRERKKSRKLSGAQTNLLKEAMDPENPSSDMLGRSFNNFLVLSNNEIPNNTIVANVLKLKEEVRCQGGIEVFISRDVYYKIDVVELYEELWVSEIQTDVELRKKLHVGDRICQLNNIKVTKKVDFIERCKREEINLRIDRLPKAKIFAIEYDVLKNSYKGVNFKNKKYEFSKGLSDPYVITEINSLTISEQKDIFKSMSSGEPIHSVVLQPSSFVNQLKSNRRLSSTTSPK